TDRHEGHGDTLGCRSARRCPSTPECSRTDCGTIFVMDVKRIAAVQAFADLPAEELGEFAGALREAEVESGATVIRADDYGSAIYLIEAGTAEVLDDAGGAITTLGPGDTFGEIALLVTGQRTATVVARTTLRVLSLSGQDFDEIRPHVP